MFFRSPESVEAAPTPNAGTVSAVADSVVVPLAVPQAVCRLSPTAFEPRRCLSDHFLWLLQSHLSFLSSTVSESILERLHRPHHRRIMPEYRECWMHFRHIQYLFDKRPNDNWTVLNLWTSLTEKESEASPGVLQVLQANCNLTRGGGSKIPRAGSPSHSGGGGVIPGDHIHLPLWPPQIQSKDRSTTEAPPLLYLSDLCLKGFRWSPRTIVADFGPLLMQVGLLS